MFEHEHGPCRADLHKLVARQATTDRDESFGKPLVAVKAFFSSIEAADKRLHAELLAIVRHISVDEYPPERVAEILKRAKDTDTYCREVMQTLPERSLFNV